MEPSSKKPASTIDLTRSLVLQHEEGLISKDVLGEQGAVGSASEQEFGMNTENADRLGSTEPEGGQQGQGSGPEGHHQGKKKKVLSAEKIQLMKEVYNKRGVVYVSRIPPHMKPMKLKQLLSAHGETLRVYCAPEDPKARKLRKRKGGNTGKNFTEGWVEFADKRVAKRTALALNGQRMGGKRRSAYYDDLWCIKYLPHFKWDDLTEEIAYQRAVHEQKMAAEVAAAKKERDFYLHQVDRAKGMRAIAERRAAKQEGGEAGGGQADKGTLSQGGGSAAPAGGVKKEGNKEGAGRGGPIKRNFMQRHAKADPTTDASAPQLADDVLMMVGNSKKKYKAAL